VIAEGARLQGRCGGRSHDSDRGPRLCDAGSVGPVTRTLIGYEPSHAGAGAGERCDSDDSDRTGGGAQTVEEGMP
jgi:hypothetical protein